MVFLRHVLTIPPNGHRDIAMWHHRMAPLKWPARCAVVAGRWEATTPPPAAMGKPGWYSSKSPVNGCVFLYGNNKCSLIPIWPSTMKLGVRNQELWILTSKNYGNRLPWARTSFPPLKWLSMSLSGVKVQFWANPGITFEFHLTLRKHQDRSQKVAMLVTSRSTYVYMVYSCLFVVHLQMLETHIDIELPNTPTVEFQWMQYLQRSSSGYLKQTFLACRRSRRDLGIREQLGVEKMDGF